MSDGEGRIFSVEIGAGDVEGFDPTRDKLDLGGVSVHNFIPVDTASGAGFMNPWSGEVVVIVGVSLGQLTVDSFLPVENDHLRQCLAGALAWAHAEAMGETAEPGVVFARSHQPGRIDRVAFDPATDVVDFRHYGTREQLSMVDGAEGVVISNAGTGQALILLGVSVAELGVENFRFYSAQVREDRLHLQLGLGPVPDAQILDQDMPVAGTNDWPTEAGPGTPPSGAEGRVFEIDWRWGEDIPLQFDPAADRLDFGWFRADQFTVTEAGGAVVIAIDGNQQTYRLDGVTLGQLSMTNIEARNEGARAEWRALLDAAEPAPTVSVADASVTEGDAGTASLSFVVTLSAPSDGTVEVDWSTFAGTARAGEDYAPALGTLVFAAGETRRTVTVDVTGDALHELDETFGLRLAAARGARLGDAEALGTIRDDDPETDPGELPAVSVLDLTLAEGDAGRTHLHVMLRLSKASAQAVTVDFALVDGTARAGEDYEAQSGTVTFAPGETSAAIHANGLGDLLVEGDERFRVVLSAPVNAVIADGEATVTLTGDDETSPVLPEISIADAQVTEGDDGTRTVTAQVTLSAPATQPVSVQWASADGSARAGADYSAASGRIDFAPGETEGSVSIQVRGDAAVEGDEAFALRLSDAVGATLGRAEASILILDDDETPPEGDGAVDYAVRSDWGAGFVADMTVAGGPEGLDGWQVAFRADFEITNIWNARIVSHVGDLYVLENMGYNARVSAGGETGFGFQAGGGAADSLTGLTLNGEDAGGGGGGGGGGEPTLPELSIAGARAAEGDDALVFAVTLSEASDAPVSVAYATGDGTAAAGADYDAASGTLTFAAGETAKSLRVSLRDDAAHEGDETLTLALSAPSGATLAEDEATGTILDDDPAPRPGLSISDAAATEGGTAPGWFSTDGARIVDAAGNTVRLAGVNWFGFESDTLAPHGLWTRGYAEMMDQMVSLGFNTIRLPFSSEMLRTSAAPNGIDFSQNPDLAGLSAIEIMDRIVDYAGEIGLRVILDHHRSTSGAGTSGNGLWYGEGGHTEESWIADWEMLAARYADDPTVIGADLHNEPHAGTWGGGGPTDWARAAEAAGDAIGAVNPNWLILVEGVGAYQGDSYWWGGALQGVRDRPIELEISDKLVYSPHDYGNSVHAQPWFQQDGFEDDLPDIFREAWGFIQEEGIAPVLLGEFGTRLEDPKDTPWFEALTAYIAGDYDHDGDLDLRPGEEGMSWTYWSWNPNSGDTGGILADDWRTVHDDKLAYLEPLQFDLPAGGGNARAVFDVTLSAASDAEVTVGWRTLQGSADESDYEGAAGLLTFAPGETRKTVSIEVLADGIEEGAEDFLVMLVDPDGADLIDAAGRGVITDAAPAEAAWISEADALIF